MIWGHEHRSYTSPEYQALTDINAMAGSDEEEENGFYIYQPGSSVATSLSEGEVDKK